jgi:6-phosphogluconolactonase
LSPGGGFAYVVNQDDGTVSAYAIDAASGALAPIAGSPFAVGSAPVGIVVHSSGKFAYVANSGSSTVTAFSIDPASGALKPIAGSPFAAGGSPLFIVVDSSGKFIYVALAIGNSPSPYVAGYSVDGTTGALTPLAGSPFVFPVGTPNSPVAFASDPQGNFLYVLHGEIYADQIDPLTGALTPVAGSPFFGAVLAADSLVIDPAGKFLYDAGYPVGAGQLIDEWTINSSTGALVRINSSIGNLGPLAVRGIDPSSHFLYFFCPSDPQQHLSCGLGSPATIDATTGVLTPSKSGASGVPVVFK